MKKIIIIILVAILLLVSGFISYRFFFDKKEVKEIVYIDAKLDTNIIVDGEINVEYGKIEYLNNYISLANGTMDVIELKYEDLGENTIKFYYNDENGKNYRFIKFSVVDTTKPYVSVPTYKTVLVNSDISFINDFFCADNHDRNVDKTLEGDYDLGTVGTYNAVYKATDESGNSVEKNIVLRVVEELPKAEKTQPKPINYIPYEELYNTYKTDNTLVGIDVSRWQGDIDFDLLENNNVEFIMIRLGGQDGVDGEYYLDSKYKQNMDEATKRGFKIGVYFYSYAYTKEEAINQAKYVIKNLKGYKLELPIVFDWECWNKFNSMNISLYDITQVQDAFLNYVNEKGYRSSRYGSKNYLINAWQDSKHLTWLAHYISETNYEGDYFMWQRCDTGKIPGINGAVDVDVLYLDKYKF